MILSLISTALLIPVLLKVDNLAVEEWPYAILPNTLLSILTNVTKTAMMVPIAACISQMKWDHFQYQANPLDHLQLYDDASRGPWGSFILLITGRAKVLSAWAFAIVTLVALGIEPSTQQTIETRTKLAYMTNTTALVGQAHNYSSRALVATSFQGYNAEVYSMSWNWCKKTFHNATASPSGLRHASVTTQDLELFAENSLYAGLNPSYAYYKEPGSSAPDFNISISVDRGLFAYITTLFTRELRSATRQGAVEDSLNLAEFMYLTDLANLTTNIADTLTAQLRSAGKDNTMAAAVEGRARYRETYYHVRWPWILVTVAEVVATAVLLGVSIILTRRQPLLKASSMALLAFGLHGWTDEEIQGVGAPVSLDDSSKGMWARFGQDEEGYLKFLRSDGTGK
ncbi:hypothetical protein SLS64_013617 [Diaporthe eres]